MIDATQLGENILKYCSEYGPQPYDKDALISQAEAVEQISKVLNIPVPNLTGDMMDKKLAKPLLAFKDKLIEQAKRRDEPLIRQVTKKEFIKDTKRLFEECELLLETKGEDYTEGSSNPLYNFQTTAKETGLTQEQVWYIFARKHWAALANYVKSNGQSESEPIESRIVDLINYLCLFKQMINERNNKE